MGGDNQAISLEYTPSLSRGIAISVDGPGTVVYEASGYFFGNNTTSPYIARASWSTSSGTVSTTFICVVESDGTISFNPYYVVKSVPVGSAGTYRAYLVGDITLGPSGVVQMVKNTAIATFYPD